MSDNISTHHMPRQSLFNAALPFLNRLIWRHLSIPARRALTSGLGFFAARAADMPVGKPVYVVGFLSSTIGQGEGARLTLEGLRQLEYPVHAIDVSSMFELQDFAGETMPGEKMAEGPGTVIFHFNPEALVFALLAAGRKALRGKRIIGYWAWETAHIPPRWIQALRFLDEVWAPSRFVAAAIQPFTAKPVRVVPHPVSLLPPGKSRRADFGIGSEFTVLTMASFHSTFDRKNPLGAIDAFREAFGDDMQARLIVKLSHAAQASPEMLRKIDDHIGGAPNIRILSSTLRGDEVRDLIASADVLLSLHRSEGFGLPLAEAMQAGTPVIATNWSGNTDFMDETCAGLVSSTLVPAVDSQGFFQDRREVWAEPSVIEAAAWLKRMAGDAGLRTTMADKARARIAAEVAAGFRSAIEEALGAR